MPASSLQSQLRIQTSTLLDALYQAPSARQPGPPPAAASPLADHAALQRAHLQTGLYRTCAGVTLLRAHDPDPRAVDGGAVLGLRLEVVSRARFLRPYYVLLNRPYPDSRHLRVHRHTVPSCIPLAGLAARYLAPPGKDMTTTTTTTQDLVRFARLLRRELVRYHNRLGAVSDLAGAAGLSGRQNDGHAQLADITLADAQAKQVSLEWTDGKTGRLVMGDDGELVDLVVFAEGERDRETARKLLGGSETIEHLVARLTSG